MSISTEEMNKAASEQKKYWDSLTSGLEFFKKTSHSVDVFDLPTWSIYGDWKEKYLKTLQYGYESMAHYWASSYLSNHISWAWSRSYEAALRETGSWKEAMKIADSENSKLSKEMKEKYS